MEPIQTKKTKWWRKILNVFLLLVFFVIGGSIWIWHISLILSIIVSIISIAMIHYFWEEIIGKEENSEVK